MKVSCNVIRDILPLYAEDMVSDDSKELVNEHICDCEVCKRELDRICKTANVPADADTGAMKKVRKEIQNRRWRVAAQTLLIVLAVLITVFNCVLMPWYIPAEQAFERIYTDDLGRLFVKLQEGTYNFVTHRVILEGEDKETYHIYAYASVYDWYRKQIKPDDLGGYEFKVGTGEVNKYERVVFGSEGNVVWGSPLQDERYVRVTALQLILAAAAAIALILTILYKFFVHRNHGKGVLYTALFFWSYVVANLMSIKLNFNTYYWLYDAGLIFGLILFVLQALLIYGSVMLTIARPKQ